MSIARFLSESFVKKMLSDRRISNIIFTNVTGKFDEENLHFIMRTREPQIAGMSMGPTNKYGRLNNMGRMGIYAETRNAVKGALESKGTYVQTNESEAIRYMLDTKEGIQRHRIQTGESFSNMEKRALGTLTYPKDVSVSADEVYEWLQKQKDPV